jgi:spore maturation protein CgeB
MKLVIFGLSISSSWGNGHATLWRGLCRSLIARGHRVVFLERDVEWYASNRDLWELPGGELVLYPSWDDVRDRARRELADADVAMVTSYQADALDATSLVLDSPAALRVFYDLDTPVTLDALRGGGEVAYVGPRGLRDLDLVLSYTGGGALDELRSRLGARRVAPLFGHVDPGVHRPVAGSDEFRAELSYMGTYAEDRQAALHELLVEPAGRLPEARFVIAGSMYPPGFPWRGNIRYVQHLPPWQHPAFFASSRITLNVTRRAMAEMGWCPSGRLFEAAASGVPLLSDTWDGLDAFYTPGAELLVARTAQDTVDALSLSDAELARIAAAARERTLAEHTSERRAMELEALFDDALSSRGPSAGAVDGGRDGGGVDGEVDGDSVMAEEGRALAMEA